MEAGTPLLIYDGHCRMCTREAARLQRWVHGGVRLESFHDAGVIERHPGLTREQCERALQMIDTDGRIYSGAEAIARVLRLRASLAPLARLYYVPGLRRSIDWGYRWVARNRFRFGGEPCGDEACRVHQPREPPGPGRVHVRNLFLRLLGVIFLTAFLSLGAQITILFGSNGLLPACSYLQSLQGVNKLLDAPTLFWIDCSDASLRAGAIAGGVLSVALILNVAPRYCLMVLWILYLSFATVGQDFLSFQWDNLLLESGFFALFITPGGFRRGRSSAPNPIGVFLMLWLVFRLHVESGAAKLLAGDPSWWDLTALVKYYETAPLPTWLGWYAHQMPLWAHKLCALFTLVVELALPLFLWGPRRLRVAVFLAMTAMQVSVLLTANYGFFNYLSMSLCLFVLDDGHLSWVAARCGLRLAVPPAPLLKPVPTLALAAAALVLVPVSVFPFFPFIPSLSREMLPVRRTLNAFRSINAYHLFAQMTRVRDEVVIEGSNDGADWLPYEFRYKPGDVSRAPAFVAPHQPRVDFQLWFLALGGRGAPRYFSTLLARLFGEPRLVAPLFARDPFPDRAPAYVRVVEYRYRFSDIATRRATGAWWERERLASSRALTPESFRQPR